jgi:fluoride exporter
MLNNILLVGLGGGIGSILRYICQRYLNLEFPFGTLAVNIIGCFLIGIFWALSIKGWDDSKRLLLMTGFCGGFTTFSAFTHESVQMLMDNRWLTFIFYITVSVVAGLLASFAGFKLFN